MPSPTPTLPSASQSIDEIRRSLGESAALFLDFDGTLSPIVSRPDDAQIDNSTRDVLRSLTDRFSVAIVSGRASADVRRRVEVEGLAYAGSHGQEIDMPDGRRFENPASVSAVPSLNAAERALSLSLKGVEGVLVERKPYSITVHFRNAETEQGVTLARSVASAAATSNGLVVRDGKKIFELRPDVDWGKGKAIDYLVKQLPEGTVPLFVGDDETDEDGFGATNKLGGVSVVVVEPPEERMTLASYRLSDSRDAVSFLGSL